MDAGGAVWLSLKMKIPVSFITPMSLAVISILKPVAALTTRTEPQSTPGA